MKNETKLKNYLGCIELELADSEAVKRITSAEVICRACWA